MDEVGEIFNMFGSEDKHDDVVVELLKEISQSLKEIKNKL